MMPLALARRYAKALFNAALAAGQLEQVHKDLHLLGSTQKDSPALGILLSHPRISEDEKEKLLHKAFEGRVQPLTLQFLVMVLKKKRQEVLPALEGEFARLLAIHRNELKAEVRSAVALEDEERKFITEKLAKMTGKNILLEEKLDPSILGGLIIRYGDKQIDGSVRHHLERLREEFKQARVTSV